MKNYQIEVRSIAGKSYIKVFLANTTNIKLIQVLLKCLKSVSVVNITESKDGKNLTVYKERFHSMASTKTDVKIALDKFFKGIAQGNQLTYNKALLDKLYSTYPDVGKLIKSGLKRANDEAEYRHSLDDFRLAIELLLRKILNNDKSLENQKECLLKFMADKGFSVETRNLFFKLLDLFSKYQNDHVKHNNNVNNADLVIMIDYAVFFIKTLLTF